MVCTVSLNTTSISHTYVCRPKPGQGGSQVNPYVSMEESLQNVNVAWLLCHCKALAWHTLKNMPIIQKLFPFLFVTYYSQNYSGIIRPGLTTDHISSLVPRLSPMHKFIV